jgi:hypothetical protein
MGSVAPSIAEPGELKLKSPNRRLLPLTAISLFFLLMPFSSLGEFIPNPWQLVETAKKNVAALNKKTETTSALVNSLAAQDAANLTLPDASPGDRSADERVNAIKEGIIGEVAKAKSKHLALNMLHQKLNAALERYNRNQTEENLKQLNTYAHQINVFQGKLQSNLEVIQNMINQIMNIRRTSQSEAWYKPDSAYKDERQALEGLSALLAGKPLVPNVVGLPAHEACSALLKWSLQPQVVVLKEKPPQDMANKVDRQEPAAGSQVNLQEVVKIYVYGQAVPYVIDLSYTKAVEVMGEAGLKVGSVEVQRALTKDDSEKVFAQSPQAGDPIPANKNAKLWHYDRFGAAAQPPPSSAGRTLGFQPGDAQGVDPRFAAFEKISPDRKSIQINQNNDVIWGISSLGSSAKALAIIKRENQGIANVGPDWSKSYGEFIIKGKITLPEECLYWWTSRGFAGNPPSADTRFYTLKLYREVFIISYTERSKKFDDDLPAKWPPIYENSKKLIDQRFPIDQTTSDSQE